MSHRLTAWAVRVLLALAFIIATEILYWRDPLTHTVAEWVVIIAGNLIGAVLVLDVSLRYRVRDVWGVMVLIGGFGLIHAVLVIPQTTFAIVPDTIITQAIGANWLLSLEMFGVFVLLLNARNKLARVELLAGAIAVGFFWGVWLADRATGQAIAPVTLALIVPLLVTYGLILLAGSRDLSADTLKLTRPEYGVMFLIAVAVIAYHVSTGGFNGAGLLVSAGVMLAFWVVLWYRADTTQAPLIARLLPLSPLPVIWVIMTGLIFAVMAWLGVTLPPVVIFGYTPLNLLELVFSFIGVVWVPLVAAVVGLREFQRQFLTGEI